MKKINKETVERYIAARLDLDRYEAIGRNLNRPLNSPLNRHIFAARTAHREARDALQLELDATDKAEPEFTCKYCGSPSYVDPSDQSPPPDYCHEADYGEAIEHPFAYFVSGPYCNELVFPDEVGSLIADCARLCDTHINAFTATPLVPQAPRTHTGGMPGLGPNEVPVAVAPKYTGPAIPDTLARYVQNLAAGVEWASGNHRVVIDMGVQEAGWLVEESKVYFFGKEQLPKLHAKLPDKPDCETAFKKWYWTYGADFNATHVRPVWMAAQHAMYEALKDRMS